MTGRIQPNKPTIRHIPPNVMSKMSTMLIWIWKNIVFCEPIYNKKGLTLVENQTFFVSE